MRSPLVPHVHPSLFLSCLPRQEGKVPRSTFCVKHCYGARGLRLSNQAELLARLDAMPPSENVTQLQNVLHENTSIRMFRASEEECTILLALAHGHCATSVVKLHIDHSASYTIGDTAYLHTMPGLRDLM
jgi:hypothetical protein